MSAKFPSPAEFPSPASGFPSPAEDYEEGRIDLNRELIASPLSTFFMRVQGEAMRNDGIVDGDLLVIDRSLNPRAGCVVVAVFEGRFIVRRLCRTANRPAGLQLESSDGKRAPIRLDDGQGEGAELWGVVIHAVHHLLPRDRPTPDRSAQGQASLRRREDETKGP
jgi:DNA polymerase V